MAPRDPAELLELTGKGPPVLLRFVEEGDRVFLLAGEGAAVWPAAVLRGGETVLRLGGQTVRGSAFLVTTPDEKSRVQGLFRRKYGEGRYASWFPTAPRVVAVVLGQAPRSPHSTEQYHRWLADEFDDVAADYDRVVANNRINRMLRERSLAELRRVFPARGRILEVGCGSGIETLPLLEAGHEVVCLDVSRRMLDVVREKARVAGVSERLRTEPMAASDLARLPRGEGSDLFDGAFSTYGALNCEPELESFAAALTARLRPGAGFVAGVYNRWGLVEAIGYAMTGRWRLARSRLRQWVPAGEARFSVDILAWSAASLPRPFAGAFSVERVEGLPVLLPPANLARYADRFARRFGTLEGWDRRAGRSWPFRLFGDYLLLTLRRAGREGTASGTGPAPTPSEPSNIVGPLANVEDGRPAA